MLKNDSCSSFQQLRKKVLFCFQKKYFLITFTSNHPIATQYQFWAMAKLRQFSHFLQQINKWASRPFSKIQTRLRVYFRSFVAEISINRNMTLLSVKFIG